MNRALLIVSAILVLFLTALVALEDEPNGAWTPEGYVKQADALIASGKLWLECHDVRSGVSRDTLRTEFSPGTPEAEWFTASYLREDVRRFNTDPEATRTPFLVDGCRLLGVDPFYHRVDLPNQRLPRWRGDILLAGARPGATLEGTSTQQFLEIRPPESPEDAGQSQRVRPDRAGLVTTAPLLRIEQPGTREVTADLFLAGEQLVIADRRDRGSPARIRVQGFTTPPGRLVRVEPGDWMQFGYPHHRGGAASPPDRAFTYLANVGEQGSVASFVRVQNREVRRMYPASALRPFLEPFSQAMDVALNSVTGGERAVAAASVFDVHLTLSRDLSENLAPALARWCSAHSGTTRPRSVSMLVMDGLSGSVRAMPSCPDETMLPPFEPLSARERERWLRNQNLIAHPIGSAGKPFWAAAVASHYPNFLDLEIRSHTGGRNAVLGCPIEPGYRDHAHSGPNGWVGLEQFIAASCNRYLIDQASAALMMAQPAGRACEQARPEGAVAVCFPAPPPGPRDTLRFCDELVEVVLSSSSRLVERSGCNNLQLLDMSFPPARSLGALANLQWYWQGSSRDTGRATIPGLDPEYQLQRYRVDPWRRVLSALHAAGDSSHSVMARLRFTPVSPEASNLALNTVEELRTDWVNLLLGGENSRWSNFQLAEALARLITGRQVVGEFVDSVATGEHGPATAATQRNLASEIDDDVLRSGVRRRVLHAMEQVLRPGGTAGALADSVAELGDRLRTLDPRVPYDLYAFAKTGTPNITQFRSSAEQRLVERFYRRGGAVWDQESRSFRNTPARRRILASLDRRTRRWIEEDVLAPMAAHPDDYREIPGMGRPEHPLYFDLQGQLRLNLRPGRETVRQGGVLILGLMAVPAARGRAASRRVADSVSQCRLAPELHDRILEVPPVTSIDADRSVVVTVAVYVDDLNVGDGSDIAVDLTRTVFPVLADYVTAQVRAKLR